MERKFEKDNQRNCDITADFAFVRDFVFECLCEAEESGMLRGEAGPEEGAILVLGGIFALAHSITKVPNRGEVEQLALRVWSVLASSLRGRHEAEAYVRGSRRFPLPPGLDRNPERKME